MDKFMNGEIVHKKFGPTDRIFLRAKEYDTISIEIRDEFREHINFIDGSIFICLKMKKPTAKNNM